MYFGAKNISVSYGKQTVLKNLTLEIKQGVTTAIIGENGSGKSTLLKTLGRLIKSQEGGVYLEGELLSNLTGQAIAQKIALLPQTPQTPPDITVYELVALGRAPHQKMTQQKLSAKDRIRVQSVLEEIDLWDLKDERVVTLSGGQRQRAWIGLILAQDSSIILLDEPTSSLDMRHQLEILSLLRELVKKYGKTVVYVIHDLNQAARFADHIVVLKKGALLKEGSVSEVYQPAMFESAFDLTVTLATDTYAGSPVISGVAYD